MIENIDKYFSGELNQREKEIFLKEVMADEALKNEFAKTQNLIALTNLSPQQNDYNLAQSSLIKFKQKQKTKNRKQLLLKTFKYAACIAVLITSTWFISQRYFISSISNSYTEIEVPKGYRTHIKLDDGTTVWLNSRSKLRYPNSFSGDKRVVILDGEAFFSVEKDESKPFIVKTTRYDVQVLGTKFNVLNYSEKAVFETTLFEGTVKVIRDNDENKAMLLRPNEQAVMKNGELEKRKVEDLDITLWQNGYLVFENELFENIMQKLELHYDVKFIIKNENALYNRYTGNFNSRDDIITILEAIQKVQKFNFSISSDKKFIYIN
jgi:ferric-dicitrate binding protein FerR (iron transport regulator)